MIIIYLILTAIPWGTDDKTEVYRSSKFPQGHKAIKQQSWYLNQGLSECIVHSLPLFHTSKKSHREHQAHDM